jgi:ATP/ADP translocase
MRFRLLVSWTWFFLVLFSYYVHKPVRDALATETRLFGPLYLATFLAVCAALPLYWRIVGRTTRRQLVFGVYQFFVACLALFAVLVARGHNLLLHPLGKTSCTVLVQREMEFRPSGVSELKGIVRGWCLLASCQSGLAHWC